MLNIISQSDVSKKRQEQKSMIFLEFVSATKNYNVKQTVDTLTYLKTYTYISFLSLCCHNLWGSFNLDCPNTKQKCTVTQGGFHKRCKRAQLGQRTKYLVHNLQFPLAKPSYKILLPIINSNFLSPVPHLISLGSIALWPGLHTEHVLCFGTP